MTLDRIDRLVREANPVPDPAALESLDASVLPLDHARRTEMHTLEHTPPAAVTTPPRRRVLIAVAVAAALVVVLALVAVESNDAADDRSKVAGPAAVSSVQPARGFMRAWARYDADGAAGYLTAGALSDFGGLQYMRLVTRWMKAAEVKFLNTACEETGRSASAVAVRCAYDVHLLGSDQLGLGPYRQARELSVRDGKITSVGDLVPAGAPRETWDSFGFWVASRYPGDVGTMYSDVFRSGVQFSDASIQLWERHTREYVADRKTATG